MPRSAWLGRGAFVGAVLLPPLLVAAWVRHGAAADDAPAPQRLEVGVAAGDPVPDVEVMGPGQRPAPLASLVAGRPTAIVVMHPTCTHCHRQIGELLKLREGAAPGSQPGVVLVSVGDSAETEAVQGRFAGLPVYRDARHQLVRRLGVSMVPVLLLADARGRLRDVHPGVLEGAELRGAVAALAR